MALRFTRLIDELKRRKVLATAGWYLGVAFVTMQIVEAVFPYLPLPDAEAAGSVVLAVLAVGFPVALVLSWVLEITPPTLRREQRRERTREEADAAIAGNGSPTSRQLRPNSVAVLPFENLSADPENAYFSDGITDDIIMSVAHVPGMRVLSRGSVMPYKESGRGIGEIARELGVATVVRGSIRRSGSRVRVVAEVVDARTEERLWADTYDRDLEDIFQVQSDVASRIGTAVRRELSAADKARIEQRGTQDADAYDLYLRARHLWNQRTESAVVECIRYLERALEHDPGFALAHSALAEAYVVLGIYGARAPDAVLPAARRSAESALEVDPTLGEAVAAEACVRGIYDWDWGAAGEGFERALHLAPSYATAHQWYALNILTPQGRFDEALEELGRAEELDRTSSAIAVGRGIVSFYARDYDDAIRRFESLASTHPRFPILHFFLGQAYWLAGARERSLEALRRAAGHADDSSETLAAVGHACAGSGRRDEAEQILVRLDERARRRHVSQALSAQILIGLGRFDEALDRLGRAVEQRATDLIWLGVRPVYDPIHETPGFDALLSTLGLHIAVGNDRTPGGDG